MSAADAGRRGEASDSLPDATGLLNDAFGQPARRSRKRRDDKPASKGPSEDSTVVTPLSRELEPPPPSEEAGSEDDPGVGPEDAAAVGPPQDSETPKPPEQEESGEYDESVPDLPAHMPYPTTIQVSPDLVKRFRRYQAQQKRKTGIEPSNVQVVLDALNACYGRYRELWLRSQRPPAQTSDLPFSGFAPHRRKPNAGTGRFQIHVRTTVGEVDKIDEFKNEAAGPKVRRSRFIEVLLEEFLPMTRKPRSQ